MTKKHYMYIESMNDKLESMSNSIILNHQLNQTAHLRSWNTHKKDGPKPNYNGRHHRRSNSKPATTVNRLEHLVAERSWESVLAHLQTNQAHEDARIRNSTTGELLYHNPDLYNHAPFHVIEALMKAYPKGILKPLYNGNQICYPIATAVGGTNDETRNKEFKSFVKTNAKCLDYRDVWLFHDAFLKCDTEVLKLMIQANPSFLYQTDSNYSYYDLPILLGKSKV